jgi:hypothetical protein
VQHNLRAGSETGTSHRELAVVRKRSFGFLLHGSGVVVEMAVHEE